MIVMDMGKRKFNTSMKERRRRNYLDLQGFTPKGITPIPSQRRKAKSTEIFVHQSLKTSKEALNPKANLNHLILITPEVEIKTSLVK